jgi:hypothetical protein
MRRIAILGLVAGCGFEGRRVGDDASLPANDARYDAVTADGGATPDAIAADAPAPDAAVPDASPPDARACPPPPAGCSAFTCASSTSCYYFCTSPERSWSSARTYCTTTNAGCIATIDSQAENDCLAAATGPAFPDLVWFGWHQAAGAPEPSGGWSWECPGAGSYVAPNWGDPAGEPNDQGGDEDCAAMGGGGAWIDGDCDVTFRFVCELP